MGKLKKVLLLVLALCVMISIMSIAATAATSLPTAGVITLAEDVTLDKTWTLSGDTTLDLNGQTLTMNVTSGMTGAIYLNGHSLTIQDNSAGQAGRIDITSSSGNGAYGFYLSGSGSNLLIEDGNITAKNVAGADYFSSKGIYAVYVSSGTSFTMSGGSLTASNANNSGKPAYAVYVSGGTANITGGTIIVDDYDTYGWSDDHLVYKSSGTVSITGGKFKSPKQLDFNGITSKLPSGYVLSATDANGYRAVSLAVAQIGETKYASLADAIAAVPTDGTATTIKMIADYEVPMDHADSSSGGYNVVNVSKDQNVILDLNGKTITGVIAYDAKNSAVITVSEYGTLTIRDTSAAQTGTITHVKYDDGVRVGNWAAQNWQTDILFNHGGTLTVEGGTIANTANGNICYAIDTSNNYRHNDATLTITGGTITSQYCDTIRMRLDNPVYGENSSRNVINISGGTISGRGGIWAQVSSGTAPKGSLTISGGTITGGDWGTLTYYAGSGVSIDDFPASITGGKITGTVELPQVNYISGGKFSLEPEAACIAEGYEAVANTDDDAASYPYNVGVSAVASVTIGEETTNYTDFAEAWVASNEAEDSILTLLADIELSDSIDATGFFTVDLNGHTIRAKEGTTANNKFIANSAHDYLIGVKYESTLVIIDGKGGGAIDGSDLLVGIKLTTLGETNDGTKDAASLTIGEGEDDFTITGGTYGISGNGNRHYTSLDVCGGTIIGLNGTGIYQPQNGYLTIEGGTIKGKDSAVEIRAGGDLSDDGAEVQFYGGAYEVTGNDTYTVSKNGSGTTVKGAAIVISQHTTKKDIDVFVNQNDSYEFTINPGQVKFAVANPENNDFDNVKVEVMNLSDLGDSYELPDGYHWYPIEDENDEYVTLRKDVAELIRDDQHMAYYASLADAIAAAQDGNTIKLLNDVSVSETVEITKSITLDGCDHTLTTTATRGIWIDSSNVNVTIENMEIVSSNNQMERSIQVNPDCDGVTLNLNKITTIATYYTVNICSNVDNLVLNIKNSDLTGWGVINLWGNNGTVRIEDSILTGINDKGYNAEGWNDFGVLVIEGDTTGQTTEHAYAYNVTVVDTTIESQSTKGNKQFTILYNDPSVGNAITLEDCSITLSNANCSFFIDQGESSVTKVKNTYLTETTDHRPELPEEYLYAPCGEDYYLITKAVAQINETKYASLADAIAAAQDGNTIELLTNIDLTATVNIEKSLTIDLNGNNITATNARALWVKSGEVAITGTGTISATKTENGSFASSSSVIRVGNSGTAKAKLTIGANVTVSTDYCYGVTVFGTNEGGVELVVNGKVTVTGTAAAISGNGNSGNKGNVTINEGAVVTATADAAIYHPQGDYLTINGGSITGPVAVYQKSGTMTISGGSFTANAQAADYSPKGDGLTPTGDAIVIDNCGYPGGAPSASISGATITSEHGKQIGYYVNGESAEGTVLADSEYTLNTNKNRAWKANTDSTYQYKIGADVYTAAASAATGNLSVGGAGNTFRFTITKNGTKLTTTAEYSAEKDNWELVYDHEYIELTKTAASGSGIGYTVKALKAGETTITFRNIADPTITASTVLTNKHAVSITYNRGTDASGNKYLLEKGALTITKITFDGVAYTGEELNTFLASHTLTADGNATINGLNVTPNATGNVYIHVTDNEDATVTARSGLLNFINAVAQIGNDYYATLASAFKAAQNGNTITLISDITEYVNFGGNTPRVNDFALTLDLNGHTFTAPANENFALRVQYGVITIKDSVGTGAIRYGRNSAILVDHLAGDYPSKVIIESGTFTGKSTVVQTGYPGGSGANYKYYGGELEVLGGTFITVADTNENYDTNGNFRYTLNMLDMNASAYAGGIYSPSSITVKGGTFNGFDPAHNAAEGAGTDFVPEGYESVETTTGTWTVDQIKVAQIGSTKYASLADAITAANADTTSDSITITLLKDIDFSTEEYAGYKWAGSTYNPLTITRSNVTIDLDGHTISEMGNAALVFGNILAKDGRIANITIKNGTLRAGKTDNVTNSYVLGIAGVDGVLVQNITTLGGINVYTGSKNVVIENCNVAGTKYYTVCAQCGSDVTIKGTTYTKNTDSTVANKSMFWIQGAGTDSDMITDENPTGAFGTSSITIESGNFTVDTSNGGVFYLSSGVKPIVKGGYFNIDPTAYVADGYAAVTSDLAGYTHKVVPYVEQSTTTAEATTTTTDEQSGTTTTTTTTTNLATAENGDNTQYVIKVETTTVTTSTSNPENPTEDTNTVYKPVNVGVTSNNNVDEHVEVTAENLNASDETIANARQTVVEAVTEQAAEFKAKLDENEASSANVLKTTAAANAIAKAAATVGAAGKTGDITDAKVILQTTLKSYTLADGTNSSVKATKVVYDIKPVAVLYNVEGTQLGEAVELDNADIKEGESFTITIPVPANMNAQIVKVSHIGTDGYSTEIGTYEVKGGYVTVTVDHFSKFELEEAEVDIDGSCKVSAAIALDDSININFYVKNLASGTSKENYKVVYSFNGETETTAYGASWVETETGSGKYFFKVAECAASQMNDKVSFKVYYNDVEIKSISYSIRDYCVNMIKNNSNQKLVELCRAVLDYGAAAQNYFNYNTANLANAGGYGLASPVTEIGSEFNALAVDRKSDVSKLTVSLNTVSKTEINFYITASDVTNVTVKLGETTVEGVVTEQLSDGRYKVTIKGIAAAYLNNVYTLTFKTAVGTSTLRYSALTYSYGKQSSQTAGELSLAIYNYYLNAKAYFG